ncbi:MAG TPA: SUF system Fe-S cluster assembly protein [Casimicrobiaceae bacterium]
MIDEAATATPSAGQRVPIEQLRDNVIAALRTIFDPEIPVNIYDLGLIYDLDLDDAGNVAIRMTLTAPGCPVAGTFPDTVASRLYEVPGVTDVRVELVWDPPWTIDKLTDDVRLQLGLL